MCQRRNTGHHQYVVRFLAAGRHSIRTGSWLRPRRVAAITPSPILSADGSPLEAHFRAQLEALAVLRIGLFSCREGADGHPQSCAPYIDEHVSNGGIASREEALQELTT